MLIDYRQGSSPADIDTDLCIIGSGAAGITLAREFIDSGVSVVVLESGGMEYSEAAQDLSEGISAGLELEDWGANRLRLFGGTTYHWGGWCATFTEMDFENRSWVPHSGWPINKKTLAPYYMRARKILEINDRPDDEERLAEATKFSRQFNRDRVVPQLFDVNALRFGERFKTELEKSSGVRVFLNATAMELVPAPDGNKITSLKVGALSGKRGQVRARDYVLACGGIENARLLLLSNSVERKGIGNRNDLVGRYFMGHLLAETAYVASERPENNVELGSEFETSNGFKSLLGMRVGDAAQRNQEVLNSVGIFTSQHAPNEAMYAFKELKNAMQRGELPNETAGKVGKVLLGLDDILRAAYGKIIYRDVNRYLDKVWALSGMSEQQPNPESRVMLSDKQDTFGQMKVALDWRLTEMDRRTFQVMTKNVALELGRLGIGRMRLAEWIAKDTGWTPWLISSYGHHLGTTRMSDDPAEGVVDRHCRVHGLGNLHVAGGSTFPTGSALNPTFTIVALALRLADRLKQD